MGYPREPYGTREVGVFQGAPGGIESSHRTLLEYVQHRIPLEGDGRDFSIATFPTLILRAGDTRQWEPMKEIPPTAKKITLKNLRVSTCYH